jgi:4'-phosphopantetheinyl transferase EntD
MVVVVRRGDPGVIEEIVPKSAASAESFGGSLGTGLFPEEAILVARATEKRRQEFTTGRECARGALAALGVAAAPILRGYRGAPQWPDGVVGSITHCDGYCAAAVARGQDLLAIGLDAEPNAPLPGGVLELVSLPAERARLRELGVASPAMGWDRLLFCAKEAVYKAWFPVAQRWLDFHEADITIDAEHGTFSARLLVPGPLVAGSPLTELRGRWLAARGLLLTAIVVSARPHGFDVRERAFVLSPDRTVTPLTPPG